MAVNRLKTTYQRNMLIGHGVSIVLVLLCCLFFYGDTYIREDISQSFTSSVIIENQDDCNNKTPISGKITVGGRMPEMRRGFLGFNIDFNIIPETSIGPISIPSPSIFQPNQPLIQPDNISFTPIDGDQLGVYTPDGYDYIFRLEKQIQSVERDVIVLRKRDPDYPLVAQERGVEGEVIILVYVNDKGVMTPFPVQSEDGQVQMLEYYVIMENPKDWFFVKKLVEVLPQWKFSPKIANGNAIGGFLNIRYSFVLESDKIQSNK